MITVQVIKRVIGLTSVRHIIGEKKKCTKDVAEINAKIKAHHVNFMITLFLLF